MRHQISSYKDGYQTVSFCLDCGKEGIELMEACNPLEIKCLNCGHNCIAAEPCPNCQKIRNNFKKTIDSYK